MIRATNFFELKNRGAKLCQSDDIVFVKCKDCSKQYLYNNETLTLYTNHLDLSVFVLNIDGQISLCLRCKNPEWDFIEIEDNDFEIVKNGEWSWAY